MSSRALLRAAAAPAQFLDRRFARFLAEPGVLRRAKNASADVGLVLPKDLARFLEAVRGGVVADFVARPKIGRLATLVARPDARLLALLAGAIPFGETTDGEVVAYFWGEDPAAHAVIATIDPPQVVCRGAGELAVICAMHARNEEPPIPVPGIAEEGAIRAAIERASLRLKLLQTGDPRALKLLLKKPLDVPPPERATKARTTPVAFGAIVEGFFRGDDIAAHAESEDRLVRELVRHLDRVKRPKPRSVAPSPRGEATERLISRIDRLPPVTEAYSVLQEREEMHLALGALGDREVLPILRTRALSGDATALDMLTALRDRELALRVADRLAIEQRRVTEYDVALVRMLVALDVRAACPELRRLLETSPLNGWRAGLEKGVLVRELVYALGELGDVESAPHLVTILESKSQEYRAIVPYAAHALGRLRWEPALVALERVVLSPKDVVCEALWAVGEIGRAHASAAPRAAALLELLRGLEPGAEATRLAALAKVGAGPKTQELRAAIDRALAEPGFRQDETSRRRAWAFRALEDLGAIAKKKTGPLVFDYDRARYWVTRDDHRVRRAAERAFAAWNIAVPAPRPYFDEALPDDVDALLEAVRDPMGIFKHNVARRLGEIGASDARVPLALAEATARLFSGPVTSTYEYDDAPSALVAFVRALAKVNDKAHNTVLLDGLRSTNHQVRAVVAENAPEDERFVPELMAMLGDPRSFLRSRAEKSLTSLGAIKQQVEVLTTEIMAVPQRLQG